MGLGMSTAKAASQVVANVRAAVVRPHGGYGARRTVKSLCGIGWLRSKNAT